MEHFIHWEADLYGWGDFIGIMFMGIGLVSVVWAVTKAIWHAYNYLRTRKEFMQAVIAQRKENEERAEESDDEDRCGSGT